MLICLTGLSFVGFPGKKMVHGGKNEKYSAAVCLLNWNKHQKEKYFLVLEQPAQGGVQKNE